MIRRLVIGAVVLAVVAGTVTYVVARPEDSSYRLTAVIEQAPNLFAGSRVTVRGVEVGRIASVTPGADGVRLALDMDDGVRIPTGAKLTVVPVTLIADRYVQIYPQYSGGPSLHDGDEIPMSRTSIPAELDQTLTQLQGLLEAVRPPHQGRGPLRRLITSLDHAIEGRSQALGDTLTGSAEVLKNLAGSSDDITGLIRNLDRVFASLAERSSEIGLINERLAVVAEALAADQRDLEGTIENVGFLSDQAASLIARSGDDLGRAFDQLDDVLGRILRHRGALSAGIRWTNAIAKALGATDSSGRGLYAYSGRQGSPAYRYRIDSRDTISCERLQAIYDSLLVFIPNPTPAQVHETVFKYIPTSYDDELGFLIDRLIGLCVDFNNPAPLGVRSAAVIRNLADRIGRTALERLLSQWFFTGLERRR